MDETDDESEQIEKLEVRVLDVLEENNGLCMDNVMDRVRLASALAELIHGMLWNFAFCGAEKFWEEVVGEDGWEGEANDN